jgi:3-oxocholest-4-en-26-oate---CoA ligase
MKWLRSFSWPTAGHADPDGIITEAARHIARYKLPKAVVFRDRVQRSPDGEADYRWAKAQVAEGLD